MSNLFEKIFFVANSTLRERRSIINSENNNYATKLGISSYLNLLLKVKIVSLNTTILKSYMRNGLCLFVLYKDEYFDKVILLNYIPDTERS